MEVPPFLLRFSAFASSKSCRWSSSTVPLFSAASNAFMVGSIPDPGRLKVEIPAPSVLVRQDVPNAGRHEVPRCRNWQLEQGWSMYVAGFTPIEARVRNHNFSTTDQQGEKAQGGGPVQDADERRVPQGNRRGWERRGGTWDASGIAHTGMVSGRTRTAHACRRCPSVRQAARNRRPVLRPLRDQLIDDYMPTRQAASSDGRKPVNWPRTLRARPSAGGHRSGRRVVVARGSQHQHAIHIGAAGLCEERK